MAKTDITTIKNWFKTGLKPSQIQFWNTWDSFWHKDEKIPISSIEDLGNVIDNKSDVNHTHSNYATNNAESLTATNVEQWKEKLGVADLKFDDESITITQYYPEFDLSPGAPISVFNNLIYSEVNKKLNAPIENNSNEYVLLADGTTAPKTDFGKVDTVMGVQAGANKNVDISGVAMNWTNASQKMSSLPDKSVDNTYNKLMILDVNGNLSSTDNAINAFIKTLQTSTDAQKDAWRIANRKSTEMYSVGQPVIDLVYPPIIKRVDEVITVSALGSNLFLNNTETGTAVLNLVDSNGSKTPIKNVEVNQNQPSVISFRMNFNDFDYGEYHLEVTHNGITNIDTNKFRLVDKLEVLPLPNLTWKTLNITDNVEIPSDLLTTGSNFATFNQRLNAPGYTYKTYVVQSNSINEFSDGDFYAELDISVPYQHSNVAGSRHSTTYIGLSPYNNDINTSSVYNASIALTGGQVTSVLKSATSKSYSIDPSGTLYIIKKGSNVNLGVLGKSMNFVSAWVDSEIMLKILILNDNAYSQSSFVSLVLNKIVKL